MLNEVILHIISFRSTYILGCFKLLPAEGVLSANRGSDGTGMAGFVMKSGKADCVSYV